MKTVNLNKESPSVGELLAMARNKPLLLVSKGGKAFVLEEADDFDREVAQLGDSQRFMRFLKKRSKERGVISIAKFAEGLTEKVHTTASQPGPLPARPRRSAVPSARKRRSPRRS